jgi:hypothetical protein
LYTRVRGLPLTDSGYQQAVTGNISAVVAPAVELLYGCYVECVVDGDKQQVGMGADYEAELS